jgi:hypothetical protein
MATDVPDLILRSLDEQGLLLVQNQLLPSVTRLVTGETVTGSWWSHPMASTIYNSLGCIEDKLLTVKLIGKKDTLVAQRLWPDFIAIAGAWSDWQFARLSPSALDLFDQIIKADTPLIVAAEQRDVARELALRLLVHSTEIHTPAGHHVKAYISWSTWAAEYRVTASTDQTASAARFQKIVDLWPRSKPRLLPWPVAT